MHDVDDYIEEDEDLLDQEQRDRDAMASQPAEKRRTNAYGEHALSF